jgi:hypothetical protein
MLFELHTNTSYLFLPLTLTLVLEIEAHITIYSLSRWFIVQRRIWVL